MPVDGRWLILGVLFVARTVMACQFQTVASTAPFLIGSLAIDYTQLGTLIGFYRLPGIFMALPGGMLGQRFGAKRLVLAGLLLIAPQGERRWAPVATSSWLQSAGRSAEWMAARLHGCKNFPFRGNEGAAEMAMPVYR